MTHKEQECQWWRTKNFPIIPLHFLFKTIPVVHSKRFKRIIPDKRNILEQFLKIHLAFLLLLSTLPSLAKLPYFLLKLYKALFLCKITGWQAHTYTITHSFCWWIFCYTFAYSLRPPCTCNVVVHVWVIPKFGFHFYETTILSKRFEGSGTRIHSTTQVYTVHCTLCTICTFKHCVYQFIVVC